MHDSLTERACKAPTSLIEASTKKKKKRLESGQELTPKAQKVTLISPPGQQASPRKEH